MTNEPDFESGEVTDRPDPAAPKRRSRDRLFIGLWLFIIGVSVHDGYLVLSNRWIMEEEEQNPVGRWLIQINDGDIWLLLLVKSAGTIVVGILLLLLRARRPRLALTVCAAVASFQLLLLCWLYQP